MTAAAEYAGWSALVAEDEPPLASPKVQEEGVSMAEG